MPAPRCFALGNRPKASDFQAAERFLEENREFTRLKRSFILLDQLFPLSASFCVPREGIGK